MVSHADVRTAAVRLDGHAVRTPLLRSDALDAACGGRIWLKPECLQVTGSFKFRGAYNRLSALTGEERARGVVAFSSGNHAQGVARAARLLGLAAPRGLREVRFEADGIDPFFNVNTEQDRALGAGTARVLDRPSHRQQDLLVQDVHPQGGMLAADPGEDRPAGG